MIYVYRRAGSDSGRRLAEELDGMSTRRPPAAGANDVVICWGDTFEGQKVLNGGSMLSKLTSAKKLQAARIKTITVSEQQPAAVDPALCAAAEVRNEMNRLLNTPFNRNEDYRNRVISVTSQLTGLASALAQPWTPGEWLARTTDHERANDLLNPNVRPDFWVKKENIVGEVRVHSFRGKSIGAGRKVKMRPDAHPWIRSIDSGWDETYDNRRHITDAHRILAHQAVAALKLDFGAVDIGELQDGTLMVLEVNRAPGIDGWLVEAYANAIRGWMNGNAE